MSQFVFFWKLSVVNFIDDMAFILAYDVVVPLLNLWIDRLINWTENSKALASTTYGSDPALFDKRMYPPNTTVGILKSRGA
ncbi:hypothetical protein BFJ68_g1392 [Fusarium oxysporum]|uniref:Uncharacterized protein n=2 Tax=Fusarium oxysporum TaxID=5507 RepID=A0A420S1N0_FUSOX|nr:hypothetical protein BFJ65_g6709 [Fusarium oxysporum f. sp. cepae]RKK27607.1 hypothetical protein BFJ67_g16041 [Fusarium oxysporum f. sp. cepae]RKK31564.1 hypothetical protein BFJ66_g15788 [Fusarium oxysporum f. sp. cepae]RKL23186.1 hypothetical protein BFJ68_g1392 [Fusarium oxysporum]